MMLSPPPRTPWRLDFPDVYVHSITALRDAHPRYSAAKAGDAEAALSLAVDLLSADVTSGLREIAQVDNPILLPITALEATGFNAIPDAMAQVLGKSLGIEISAGEIVQSNTVGHTRARSYNRLVTPAAFEGDVRSGRTYILVDDHVGLGGTLANLKGHLETNGAIVAAMTTLTQSRDAHEIALRQQTLDVLKERHGEALESFWREEFGHGLECLTELEGKIIGREPTVELIRDRLAQAAVEARGRGLDPAVELGRELDPDGGG